MNKVAKIKRDVNGILLLDKPKGLTSNAALQIVKRIYQANKAGHSGSLDPLATGMLPICFGEATKFCRFLLEADKQYEVTAQLGVKTTTGDAEGKIIAEAPVPKITAILLDKLFSQFTGTITQIPSMYSALKHQGQPLYKLARQGIEIARKKRDINIYSINLLSYTDTTLNFEVYCSKGTYIRTLVEDMGEILGCGAYVRELRRQFVQPYQYETMHPMSNLENCRVTNTVELFDSYLLPVDSVIANWPKLTLSDSAAYYLQQGQAVLVPHAPTSGWLRLSSSKGAFLGVGEIQSDGRVAPRRLVQTALATTNR